MQSLIKIGLLEIPKPDNTSKRDNLFFFFFLLYLIYTSPKHPQTQTSQSHQAETQAILQAKEVPLGHWGGGALQPPRA